MTQSGADTMARFSPAADQYWLRLALLEAAAAAARGEVPVGAVVVNRAGEELARAGNACVASCDPSAHAEILALRAAALRCGNYRLPGAVVYVTLEPCAMCAAAMVQARVARLVFGAVDPKAGAVVSRYRIGTDGLLNHVFAVTGEVLAEECAALLQGFFRARRD